MKKHPVDEAIARMSPRDQQIANELAEAGFSDEDLYAALPSPGAERLLRDAPAADGDGSRAGRGWWEACKKARGA